LVSAELSPRPYLGADGVGFFFDLLAAMRDDLGRQCDPAEFDRSRHTADYLFASKQVRPLLPACFLGSVNRFGYVRATTLSK
jgi:hypothetical protein